MVRDTREPGVVAAGWQLLWQTQRMLWSVYAINLVLGFFSALGLAYRVGKIIDHSVASEHLYHGFDLAYFIELAANPGTQLAARPSASLGFAAVFFIIMLFATGGILDAYARNRMLVPGEFFQSCGAFFWRIVRLLLWFIVVLIPIVALASAVNGWADTLASESPSEKLGFHVEVVGLALVFFLLMAVRLWFDMAQVRAVAEDERGMTRALGRAFKTTVRNFVPLFWLYFRISAIAWIGTFAALYVWIRLLHAESTVEAFLLAQFIAWLWIATRLWQRASEMTWYLRHRPAPALVEMPLFDYAPEIPPEPVPHVPPEALPPVTE